MRIFAHLIGLLTFTIFSSVTLYAGLAVDWLTPIDAGAPSDGSPNSSVLSDTSVPINPVTDQADSNPPNFPGNPLIAPADGAIVATFGPTFDWADASDPEGSVISYTLVITGPAGQATTTRITTTDSIYTPTTFLSNGDYTWTVQAQDMAGNLSGYVTPPAAFTVTVQFNWQLYLPIILKSETPVCPTSSNASFNLIPISGSPADHPDYLHGDLNLSLRGYAATTAFLGLVDYSGSSDSNAPQLAGLFEPNRFPGITAVYQVNSWNWGCGLHGCPGPAITNPAVTLMDLNTTLGEPIYLPERNPNIWSNYKAMVLYAEEQRITLGYTRQDTVANGYAVHLENICVDPNLLALYRAQTNSAGWHITGELPALDDNQRLGTALGSEMGVAIRDRGAFMDPRSRKDWWRGY